MREIDGDVKDRSAGPAGAVPSPRRTHARTSVLRVATALATLLPACTDTVTETEIVERVDTVVVHPAVPSYRAELRHSGLGALSMQLTDVALTARGTLVAEQRGSVQTLDGDTVLLVPTTASPLTGLFAVEEVGGTLYASYSDSLGRLTVAREDGRVIYQTVPYRIEHYAGGLLADGDGLLVGYGNRKSFTREACERRGVDCAGTGPDDARDGGVVRIDLTVLPDSGPAPVDTIAVGLRQPWSLVRWDDRLVISSSGEFLEEGIYRMPWPGPVADFGYPAWEATICHTEPDCPERTPPWISYTRSEFGCSAVVGGAVWDGRYWFADFCEAWLRTIDPDGTVTHQMDLAGRISRVKRVGDRLFVVVFDGGELWEIVRA